MLANDMEGSCIFAYNFVGGIFFVSCLQQEVTCVTFIQAKCAYSKKLQLFLSFSWLGPRKMEQEKGLCVKPKYQM